MPIVPQLTGNLRNRTAALLAAAFCFTCVAAHGQGTETQVPSPILVTIDAQQTAPPVSKYQFGMFIEHIRTLIYRSLWSEMLDDRKFYFPISSKEPDAPAQQQGGPSATCSSANGGRLAPTKLS